MSFPIVIGWPDGGGKARGTNLASPAERLRRGAFLNFILHRERYGAIFAQIVVPVMRTVGAHTVTAGSVLAGGTLNHDTKTVRTLFSGFARVQPSKQSPRCIAQALHLQNSFRDAHAFHEHLATEGIAACAKKLSSRSISP